MKKLTIYIVLALLCSFSTTKGQFYKPSEKTIRLGETLPESFYQRIHQAVNAKTGAQSTLKLDKYRDKLIILDFWATWCGPCIYSLNKLDSTLNKFDNKNLIVIPVTYQNVNEAKGTLNKYKWSMKSIVSDTTLAQIFPHIGIPYQVWIKDNKVIAIPKPLYATTENIIKAVKGQNLDVSMNNFDKIINPKKQLFIEGNGKTGIYYSNKYARISKYLPEHPKEKVTFLQMQDTSILYAVNMPIQELFYNAYKDEIFAGYMLYDKEHNAIQWEISDSLKMKILDRPSIDNSNKFLKDSIYSKWIIENSYGYNLRFPEKIKKSEALYFLQQDLNRFFGKSINIEAKIINSNVVKYAVLRLIGSKKDTENKLKSQIPSFVDNSNIIYKNKSFRQIPNRLYTGIIKSMPDLEIPRIIDSTGIDPNLKINMYLTSRIDEGKIDIIRHELARYGLTLTFENKAVPILQIREKQVENIK